MKEEHRHLQCLDPEVGELLVPYGLGTLDADDAAKFEDHLLECEFCRAELEAGFEAFAILREHRPELVERMQAEGEDFESLVNGLQTAAAQRTRARERGRWRRMVDAVLNPWVYGPAVVGAAAMLLIVHMTRPPKPPITLPLTPKAHQSYLMSQVPSPTPTSESKAEADAVPETMPRQSVPKKSVSSVPETRPMKPLAEMEATPAPARTEEQPLAAPAPSQSELTAPAVKIDVAPKPVNVDSQPPLPMAEHYLAAPQPLMIRAGTSQPSQPGLSAVQERVLALLNSSSLTAHREKGTLDMQSILAKQPGFKVDPEGQNAKVRRATPEHGAGSTASKGLTTDQTKYHPSAAVLFAETAEEQPGDSTIWFDRGMFELRAQNWVAGAQALETADSVAAGRNRRTRYYLALALIMNGNVVQSRPLLESVAGQPDSLAANAAELIHLLNTTGK